ncbi:hypothetical protein D9619_004127 [Psilocybe cf. subviscida]|uniref:Extracellular membrane protein CFEM domain-containing protein n=1 Tax=Psilocybe cf. subviscida TaxID=2480587 RepID=A0A8H5BPW5_9AGAR|nr:hypothetical protein D9619_004127 [Psilocybe cf. subviscida]
MRSSVIIASLLTALPMVLAQASGGFDPSSIPSSCLTGKCQAYVDAFSKATCTDLSCVCTNNVVSAMKSCLECISTAGIAGVDKTVLDSAVNTFVDGCKAAGHPVSASGGSSSPGSSGTGSGTGSSGGSSASSGTTATSPAATGGAGDSVTKTSGASGSSFHVGGLVAGAALAGAILL